MALSSPSDVRSGLNEGQAADLVIWSIGGLVLSQSPALQGLERLKASFPGIPLVLLADREDVIDVAEAIRCGASGYIPTSLDKSEIAEILRFVRSGGTFVPASIILDRSANARASEWASPASESPFRVLTSRERDVVDLLRQAKSNKIIAYELDLSESTVKVIVHRILGKLNAANRTEVACLAQKCFEGQRPDAT
ncbi:MAG: response regulator transcription factor [Alphaproteobacteria bacterium]